MRYSRMLLMEDDVEERKSFVKFIIRYQVSQKKSTRAKIFLLMQAAVRHNVVHHLTRFCIGGRCKVLHTH